MNLSSQQLNLLKGQAEALSRHASPYQSTFSVFLCRVPIQVWQSKRPALLQQLLQLPPACWF